MAIVFAVRGDHIQLDQLLKLTELGQAIQKEFGSPQDIEWAYAGGKAFILQSRPITSLFPVPRVSFDPLLLWFSFGAFQGVTGPITPLGQESLQRVILGVARRLGTEFPFEDVQALVVAGERLWIKVSDLLRNPIGKRLVPVFLTIGEPGSVITMRQLSTDPRLGAGQGRVRISTLLRILRFLHPVLLNLPRVLLWPEKARNRFDAQMETFLRTVQIPRGKDRFESLGNVAAYLKDQKGVAEALPVVVLATREPAYEKTLGNMEEVRARGGEVIAVATAGDEGIGYHAEHVLHVPATSEPLSAIPAVASGSVPPGTTTYFCRPTPRHVADKKVGLFTSADSNVGMSAHADIFVCEIRRRNCRHMAVRRQFCRRVNPPQVLASPLP